LFKTNDANGTVKMYNFKHLPDGTYSSLVTEKGGHSFAAAKKDVNVSNMFSEELEILENCVDEVSFSTRPDGQTYLTPKIINRIVVYIDDAGDVGVEPAVEEGAISGEEYVFYPD